MFGRMVYAKVPRRAVTEIAGLAVAAAGEAVGNEVAQAAGLDLAMVPAVVTPAVAAEAVACPLAEMPGGLGEAALAAGAESATIPVTSAGPLVELRELADVPDDRDGLLALVAEVAAESQSTLVFCG